MINLEQQKLFYLSMILNQFSPRINPMKKILKEKKREERRQKRQARAIQRRK